MRQQRFLPGIVIITIGLLVGCATPYQRRGFLGGYSDTQVDSNTFLVEFEGNAHTSRETVEIYFLYRCAELTAESSEDYFILEGKDVEAMQNLMTTPGQYTSYTTYVNPPTSTTEPTVVRATTTGTYYPPETLASTTYTVRATVKIFNGSKPSDNPNAYEAREVLRYLEPRIHK